MLVGVFAALLPLMRVVRPSSWLVGAIVLAVAVLVARPATRSAPATPAARFDWTGSVLLTVALVLVAAGSGLTVFMSEVWQLVLLWGVLVGVGTGSIALAFVAVVTGRWMVGPARLPERVLAGVGAVFLLYLETPTVLLGLGLLALALVVHLVVPAAAGHLRSLTWTGCSNPPGRGASSR